MEVYSPNMGESGACLCQVKQLPCPSVPLSCLQAGGNHRNNLPQLTCRLSVNGVASALTPGPTPAIRNRVSTATAGTWTSSECMASALGEDGVAPRGVSKGKVLVTGGGGYFGFRLGRDLASQGFTVILLDICKPSCDIPDGATFYQSDIRDYASLYKICEGVECVFHTAAYGMSGPEQLKREQVESVNVGGTNNVINVCKERSIPRLVYTSTTNVVFAGRAVTDGDEASVPYVPNDLHIDHYSRTKAIAEQMVLLANGSHLTGGGRLQTCVLRPCGIYGPGEWRHLHRVIMNVKRRLFSFRFGDPNAKMNWVHVDNLVLAHRLAAEALTIKRSCIASGQTYFINDGVSVNLFDWLTPLFEKLGYSRPLIHLPFSLVYSAAIMVEYLHLILRPVIEVPLLFTRSEARNITVNHTFKIDKARRELGFCPKPYNLGDCVEHYLKSQQTPPNSASQLPQYLLLLMGIFTLALLCFLAFQIN
uniref:Short chain dehydrogenase/reductase family 42E, member 2 n=1 Tax=Oryzias sinensis TaxID=183150 RepID=A0A8C7X7K6_9TELE